MKSIGYIIFCCFCLFLPSCFHISSSITKEKKETISKETIERTKGKIELLPHQLLPIDYLHKHPEIKGLLINHYMGTGKTYLGIAFAQSYPNRPILIIAPKFLENNWQTSIEVYGASNPKRFLFVSYEDAPKKLLNMDLSEYIVLADELHNIVRLMRSLDPVMNEKYTEVYMKIRSAFRILGLTGTPIYSDETDLAFLINLVSGKDLMPFNKETFRLNYTKILPARQFFRGYVIESNIFFAALGPIISGFVTGLTGDGFLGLSIGAAVGTFLPAGVGFLYNLNTYKMRELNLEKFIPVMNEYISYFKFDESSFKDFPKVKIKTIDVSYNREQYSFFLHMVEGDLPVEHLQRLLKNNNVQQSDEFVKINSSQIHERIYNSVGAGRDIGNFEFMDKEGKLIEPPKFLEVIKDLKKHNGQSVLYSNYYETGTLSFARFLKRQAYKKKYEIIHPNLSAKKVGQIVNNYNTGKTKLLLLHPDVTEGISLKGTEFLYVLEPVINPTNYKQVEGRTRRLLSHTHLPADKQIVNVKIYKSSSSPFNFELANINKANWYKRYRELNYLSKWGLGLYQIDKKVDQKSLNPEELAELKFKTIERNLKEMQKLLTKESIENIYALP